MISLLDYQMKAVKWAVNRQHGIIVMRPGRGKTYVALGTAKILMKSRRVETTVLFTHPRGVEAYRKVGNIGVPITIIETVEDVAALERPSLGSMAAIFVVSTGLLGRLDPRPGKGGKPRKELKTAPNPEDLVTDPLTGEALGPRLRGKSVKIPNTTHHHHHPTTTDLTRDLLFSLLLRLVLSAGLLIIDEIHNYRVRTNQGSSALLYLLRAYKGRCLGMSATPFYSKLEESHVLYEYINPSILGTYQSFADRFMVIREGTTTGFVWVNTPLGRKRVEREMTFPIVEGYKDLPLFMETIEPYLYLDDESDFEIDFEPVTYGLSDTAAYEEILAGIGMAKATALTLQGPQGAFRKLFRGGETVLASQRGATAFLCDPADVQVGWEIAVPDQRGDARSLKVLKKTEDSTEADIIARLPPLFQFLSRTPEKLSALFSVLDTIGPESGALIYCQYLDTIAFLEEQIPRRYHRQIEVIKGGERDMAGRLKELPPTAFVIISKVALQSLDFYYDTLVIYEPVTNPGSLEQLMGRITRMNSTFRKIRLFSILAIQTVEHYFYERLIYLCSSNVYTTKQVLTHVPFPGLDFEKKGASLRALKRVLLWRK